MANSRKLIAVGIVAAGVGVALAGVAMIYPPAAFILGGAAGAALGLFVVNVGGER